MLLKSDSHLPKRFCVICLIENLLEVMKNAFYFILKALFIIKIFKYLSRLFDPVGKMARMKSKFNFTIRDVTPWFINNYNTHIAKNLTK